MRKLALVFSGFLMLGGVARADDSVLIGDKALDGMTAGTGCGTACIDIYKTVWSNVYSSVYHNTYINGYSAESIADAVALGSGALTITTNKTLTDPFQGISASSGYAASYSNPVAVAPPCCKP